ncbi:Protein of unknown function DUF217 [Sulfolobus islandicus Y.G.57.14]|jgi:predicted CopG family antitoxin|uniref:Antitoxin n=5 Tax=Saccharolobus islandicus TaxID=43080 RepID=C3MLR0_SACI2|nr:antitoxin VapB family protein [Sulfolobus islandicus]ACP34658.1 Protein of unknown function DUF217 [Sulfolobus islandicus L.S.2.15]ACP44963.1 Protein of unknown function DUF217 [Sulfolobus islandicus Y.G.57.14]ACP49425.1 Protein of unknown function DUF217 [Sulfolobus islandicus Y.N.15.51]ADB86570.1 Protein of unknown function DUF217 [Sulfolobus islandicus L.D.8.5]ADX84885.1 VapB-type antitoxin [Sulfolobus islandicus REY15A]
MAKTITISNKAYEALLKEKKEGESFSDVIIRLTSSGNKEKLLKFAGIWKDAKIDDVMKELEEMWSKWNV